MGLAKTFHKTPHLAHPLVVHIVQQPAHARIAGVEPLARGELDDIVNQFPLLKRIQERRERAQVQSGRADVQQMVVQPHQLRQNRPQVPAAGRQLDAQQFLDRVMPGNLVGQRRDVVHPVDDRHVLIEVQVLAQLFKPAVQEPDVRNRLDDRFPVQRQDQPQRGVRRGVLRPKVQRPQVLLGGRISFSQIVNFERHDSFPNSPLA